MRVRRRTSAWLALTAYVLGVFVIPQLHRLHHALHGADHIHTAIGTVFFHLSSEHAHHSPDADAADDDDDDDDDHDHHDDAAAAHLAGVAPHHHDHDHHDHDHPFDPDHGRDAPEHAAVSLLAAHTFHLRPPARLAVSLPRFMEPLPPILLPRRRPSARGPPTV